MKIIKKGSISAYNRENPDDETSYKEVKKQLEDDLDFAVESLFEELLRVKDKWFDRHSSYTEFLNIDRHIVDKELFAKEVVSRVLVRRKI